MRIEFNNTVLEVREREKLGRVLSFDTIENRIEMNQTEVTFWGKETLSIINDFINTYSRAHPMPADLISRIGENYQCYLHFVSSFRSDTEIKARVEMRGSGSHFFNIADGCSFQYLHSMGFLPESISTKIKYQVFPNTTRAESFTIIGMGIILTIQLIQATLELAKLVADFLDILGTGILTAIAKAIAVAIYFAVALLSFIQFGIQVRNTYAPPLRQMYSTPLYTLLQNACQGVGFTLESFALSEMSPNMQMLFINKFIAGKSIFGLFEYEDPDTIYNSWFPREGDTFPLLGQAIRDVAKWFNLTVRVFNNVIRMEKESYFQTSTTIVIPEFLAGQEKTQDESTFNTNPDRVWQAKTLRYPEDESDIHSKDITRNSFNEKRARFINTYPNTPDAYIKADQDLSGYNGLVAPFGLIKRKDELFRLEKLIRDIVLKPLDAVTGIFGGGTNYASTFTTNRTEIAVIENLYFNQTRIFWNGGNGKQPVNFMDFLSTEKVYNDFHLDLEPANTSAVVRSMTIPYYAGNFANLSANNFVQTQSGKTVKIVKIDYSDEWDANSANVDYQEKDNSMDNVEVISL